jgi:1-acyl-sn-glycerol-3-phosphate acyltransferase
MALDVLTAAARITAASYLDAARAFDVLGVLGDDPLDGDPLDAREPEYIEATLPALRALSDVYHRGDVEGLENIPTDEPVLLVGNHSGGTLIADTFIFSQAFYDHFGTERRFHQLAHDLVFKVPGIKAGLMRYGTVPANPDNMRRALERGAALLVYPGGDYESYRPSWESAKVDFGGRKGFVRLARELGVRIVPVVAIGGQETALFLGRGRRFAKALQLNKTLRLKVLPAQIAPPFGLTVLDLPLRVPLPAKISIRVMEPIDLAGELGESCDPRDAYDLVVARMQGTLDDLAEDRTLPVLG